MIKQKRGMYTMMEQLRTEILSKVSEQLGNKAAEKIENAVTLKLVSLLLLLIRTYIRSPRLKRMYII